MAGSLDRENGPNRWIGRLSASSFDPGADRTARGRRRAYLSERGSMRVFGLSIWLFYPTEKCQTMSAQAAWSRIHCAQGETGRLHTMRLYLRSNFEFEMYDVLNMY